MHLAGKQFLTLLVLLSSLKCILFIFFNSPGGAKGKKGAIKKKRASNMPLGTNSKGRRITGEEGMGDENEGRTLLNHHN